MKYMLILWYRGGIRGIVILEVLRHIQEELGGHIPVQDFFDLIVGTRSVDANVSLLAASLGAQS